MDNKNAQVLGCFIGILVTLIITLPLYSLFSLPVWVEYAITSVFVLIFSTISIVILSKLGSKLPPAQPVPSKELANDAKRKESETDTKV